MHSIHERDRTLNPDASELEELRKEVSALRGQLAEQSKEIDKLGRVVTQVMGEEYDTIMTKLDTNQRATLRWIGVSASLGIALMRDLAARELVDEVAIRDRVAEIQRRLLERADSMGADVDLQDLMEQA